MSFILFKGSFSKNYRLIALSLLVVFLYGSMIWYVFPIKENMSWEGHLSGLIVGFVFALFFKKTIAKPKKYQWEDENFNADEDPFLRHFDADGNFIDSLDNLRESQSESGVKNVVYSFKENKKD